MFNISFLNSTFLAGLLAASIPILIHLFNRRRPQTVRFSNVEFLRKLQKDTLRKFKIRRILLLILRTLIIALLVLAFSRPTLKEANPTSASSVAAVIFLDNSYSMGKRTAGERALDFSKTRALELVNMLDKESRIAFLTFSDRIGPNHLDLTQDIAALKDALTESQITYRSTDITAALKEAKKILKQSTDVNKEVYIFTDLARNAWSEILSGTEALSTESLHTDFAGISFYIVPTPDLHCDNVSIDRIEPEQELLSVGKPITIKAQITNYGEKPISAFPAHLYIDGKRRDQALIDLESGKSGAVFLRFVPQKGGQIEGYVQIGDDALSSDNRRFFVIAVPQKIDVLLVGGDQQDTYFIGKAFSSIQKNGSIRMSQITYDRLSDKTVQENDVIVLSNVPQLPSYQLGLLRSHLKSGKGLLISLGDKVNPRFYNQKLLTDLSDIRLKSPIGIAGVGASYYSLGKIDLDHPLFRNITEENSIISPKFYVLYSTLASPEVRTVARYKNGLPAICDIGDKRAKVILYTSSLDLKWADLPLRGIFLPLFSRIVQYLSAPSVEKSHHLVGEDVKRQIPHIDSQAQVIAENPVGERSIIWPQKKDGVRERLGSIWKVGNVEYPGIWRIRSEGKELERFSVNVVASESNPRRIDDAKLNRIFEGLQSRIIRPDESIVDAVVQFRYGRELWREFLIAALLFMVMEIALSRVTSRDL